MKSHGNIGGFFCAGVQIFDLANDSHAKDVQEDERKGSPIGNSRLQHGV